MKIEPSRSLSPLLEITSSHDDERKVPNQSPKKIKVEKTNSVITLNVPTLIEEACKAIENNKISYAHDLLSKAEELDSDNYKIYMVWGYYFLALGTEDAISRAYGAFSQAVEINPCFKTEFALLEALIAEGEIQTVWDELLTKDKEVQNKKDATKVYVYSEIAQYYYRISEMPSLNASIFKKAAVVSCQKVLDIDPKNETIKHLQDLVKNEIIQERNIKEHRERLFSS